MTNDETFQFIFLVIFRLRTSNDKKLDFVLRLDAADDTGEAIREMYFALFFDCKAVTRLRGGGGGN